MKKNWLSLRFDADVSKLLRKMKLTLFIFLLAVLGSFATESYSQATKLTLDIRNSTVKEILNKIESKSEFRFFYSGTVDVERKTSINQKNEKIFDILDELFEGTGVKYEVRGRQIALVQGNENFGFEEVSFAQQKPVSGKVTDSSNQPLPGVTVVVKGTIQGTATNADGAYFLTNIPENAILQFSFVGMQTTEIFVGDQSTINVSMETDAIGIEEVVAIGYGVLKKEKVVTPISSVDARLVKIEATNSLDRSLEGKISGLSVKQGSGAPGGGSELQIRGAASIGGGSQPLIVIDGVPIQAGYSKEQSVLSLLNQSDINSIDVLKGASATAIYGSRGSNGVVLITTEKGKQGKTEFMFSAGTGVDNILPGMKLDLMNAEEFARWRKENAYEHAAFYGKTITDQDIPEVYRNPEALGEGTDWYDLLTRTGIRQDYNLSVSHGTEKFTGYFSLGYLKHAGTIENTGFERFSMRANMAYQPNDYLKFELSINPSLRTWNNRVSGPRTESFGSLFLSSPLDGPYKEEGAWERDNPDYYDGEWDLDIWSPGTFSNYNSLYALKKQYDKTNNLNLFVTQALELKPVKDLTIRSQYNLRTEYNTLEFFRPSTVSNIFTPPPLPASGDYNTDTYSSWQWSNTADYSKQIGDHSLSALIGFSAEHYKHSYNRLHGSEYSSDKIRTINAAVLQTGSSSESNWSMLSYFARVNYDYKSKYLLTASIRRDGSSRFGSNNRWAYFPSFSAGWNVSKENFFPETTWISNLKLRGGYGTSGNNDIGNYTWIPTLAIENYSFGNDVVDGQQVNSIENSLLGWEKAFEYSAGIELALFKGRIAMELDYYDKTTEDMLWGVAIPVSSGFSSIQDNIGEIRNTGIEYSLSTRNIVKNDFTWNTSFNIFSNKNEVLSLGKVDRILTGWKNYSITMPGQPIAMFYGWELLGVLNNQDDVDNNATFPGQLPGSAHYRNLDDNDIINANDKLIIGNPHPKFRGGIVNTFIYKNIDLNIAMSFSHDFDVFSQLEGDVLNLDGVFNVLKIAEERWRSPDQPGNGIIPASFHQTNFMREPNSSLVNNVSFIKGQNVSLGYTLNQKTDWFSSLRIYCSVQNAFLWTNYKYGNPDINREGDNSLLRNFHGYDYPISRTFMLGLDVKF